MVSQSDFFRLAGRSGPCYNAVVTLMKERDTMYHTILFDLDGTLTDSKEGVFNCLRYTLEKMGRPIPGEDVLRKFIGPPLQDSYARYCGFDAGEIRQGLLLFKERYDTIGWAENMAAPGMAELCARLKAEGYVLALASSKPEPQCNAICKKFGFADALTTVVGSAPEIDWEKEDVVREALRRLGIHEAQKSTVLMVGDRKFDVLGARACGLDCVGVEFFGYADPGELADAGAVSVVDTAQALEQFIHSH